jgi:tetratricopeptide (TPR) repeat protein
LLRLVFTFISLCVCIGISCSPDAVTLLEQSASLLKLGRRDDAVALLDRVKKDAGLRPLDKFQLGWLYGQAKEFRTAIAIFDSLPETVPDPLTHHYAIALSYFNLGRFQNTVEILTRLKDRGLTDPKTINLLGVAYAKAGEAEKAYNSLREGVAEGPASLTGYLNLVTLCVDYQNLELAEKIASQGLMTFPNAQQLYVSRGAVRMLAGKREPAREDFRAALKMFPRDREALFMLALCEYQMGLMEDAIATLRVPINGGFADPDLHYLMAESLLRLDAGASEPAMRELDRALQLDPNLISALVLKSKIYLQRSNPRAAVAYLERARTMEPESRAVLYNLAKAYQALGRNTEADTLFRQVKEDNRQAVDTLAQKKIRRVLVERPSVE